MRPKIIIFDKKIEIYECEFWTLINNQLVTRGSSARYEKKKKNYCDLLINELNSKDAFFIFPTLGWSYSIVRSILKLDSHLLAQKPRKITK